MPNWGGLAQGLTVEVKQDPNAIQRAYEARKAQVAREREIIDQFAKATAIRRPVNDRDREPVMKAVEEYVAGTLKPFMLENARAIGKDPMITRQWEQMKLDLAMIPVDAYANDKALDAHRAWVAQTPDAMRKKKVTDGLQRMQEWLQGAGGKLYQWSPEDLSFNMNDELDKISKTLNENSIKARGMSPQERKEHGAYGYGPTIAEVDQVDIADAALSALTGEYRDEWEAVWQDLNPSMRTAYGTKEEWLTKSIMTKRLVDTGSPPPVQPKTTTGGGFTADQQAKYDAAKLYVLTLESAMAGERKNANMFQQGNWSRNKGFNNSGAVVTEIINEVQFLPKSNEVLVKTSDVGTEIPKDVRSEKIITEKVLEAMDYRKNYIENDLGQKVKVGDPNPLYAKTYYPAQYIVDRNDFLVAYIRSNDTDTEVGYVKRVLEELGMMTPQQTAKPVGAQPTQPAQQPLTYDQILEQERADSLLNAQ